ncbi:uncharacterized protein THITE_128347 [Thermothielavioides terrestris NRRL 8126]|uniref:Uncharacterized protein n=1 Tax=Thermothielavioides terrestris (strain ATCC 38088 / NRRL 8126) TaxID=578455 RepID=G2QZD4_THETT|nr:uncharacterized protein THITE_128347 [Thermothielavioides terrestris NRRL 8126]AEO67167.1 hypothetical protein THITE_128347 [Thermothielavioides terrestris NRRL 8126]
MSSALPYRPAPAVQPSSTAATGSGPGPGLGPSAVAPPFYNPPPPPSTASTLAYAPPVPIPEPVPGQYQTYPNPNSNPNPNPNPAYFPPQPPPPAATTVTTVTTAARPGLAATRSAAESALRELAALQRQRAMVVAGAHGSYPGPGQQGPGQRAGQGTGGGAGEGVGAGVGAVNGAAAGTAGAGAGVGQGGKPGLRTSGQGRGQGQAGQEQLAGDVEERVRVQTGLVLGELGRLVESVREIARRAEGERWRRVLVGGVIASVIPLVKRLFRRPRDEDESANRTEYAFRKSRGLISRILASTRRPGLGTLAFFVFAVLYIFQNEVSLRVARTVRRRLRRLVAKVEQGREALTDDDVKMLRGWRWRVLTWSE